MIFKSHVYTQASGSIAGTVFSHNRGGMYTRARTIPVNPGSVFQQAVRGYVAQLTSLWMSILTAAERAAWDNYADLVNIPNSIGDPINVGGLAMYVRSNVPRLQAGIPRVDTGPVVYNLGAFTPPGIASITAPTALSLTFDNTDAWANEDDAAMLVYGSRGMNPSINFFKGPYRYADKIDGDGVTPPTSPAAIVLPFPLQATQKAFVRIRVSRADGRLSSSFRMFGTVV